MNEDEKTRKIEESKYLCRTDLKYLCRDILRMRDWDVCHDDLSNFLKNSKKRKKIILIPREHLKSSIITIGTAIQHILNNPNVTILFANAVQGNAESFLRELKEYLENKSILRSLFGEFKSDKWNETEIIDKHRTKADKTPTISVAGADKALASQHYDIVYMDDIVNRQTISTQEQRLKTKKFYSDCMDLLKKPDGILYVVGTRWDLEDLYGWILKDLTEDYDIYVKGVTEDGSLEGKYIFPKKFNINVMNELLRDKGSYEVSCQYFNNPKNPASRIFNPPVRYWQYIPEKSFHVITVDPAISKRKESCDGVVMDTCLTPANQTYVCDYKIFKENQRHPDNIINAIFDFVIRFRCSEVGIESNGYQEVLCYLIKDEMEKRQIYFNITEINQNEDKAMRILTLQPIWERGDLLIKPGMVEIEKQFDDFRKPIVSPVDILDTLAMRLQVIGKGELSTNVNPEQDNEGWIHPRFREKAVA